MTFKRLMELEREDTRLERLVTADTCRAGAMLAP
jgi:hypothetical protein